MLLTNRGMSYNEMKLNEDFTKENLLELYPNVMTFPVIVIDGFNIGGFTELNKVLSESVKDNRKILTEEV
jgi:glutaredoxin